ncbi:hypothetical protein [Nocardia salmonicida]|uniref:hypothetical protein n=1 Tax=Nocardia salmonicida TaxID=53431 RepID=UPI0033F906F0
MIEPLTPPLTGLEERIHGPLPVFAVPRSANKNLAYGIAVVGESGRVADRSVFTQLGWSPGTRLTLSCPEGRLILVRETEDGSIVMTGAGFLRIPFRTRRRVGLMDGDRVLLMAHRTLRGLLIHPPAVLDNMTGQSRRLLEETL